MSLDFIKSFNWIDLVVLAILVRVIYTSVQTGFIVELFKLLGTVVTLFICFHYYSKLSGVVFKSSGIAEGWAFAVVFAVLWAVCFVVCKLIRDGIFLIFTVQAQAAVDKWGAPVLAVGRFFLVASMALFLLLTTGNKYLETMTARSFAHKYAMKVAPEVYRSIADGVVTKLVASEKFNERVGETVNKVRAK